MVNKETNNVGILFMLDEKELDYYQFFFEKKSNQKSIGNIGIEYVESLNNFNFNVNNIHLFENTSLGNVCYNELTKRVKNNIFDDEFNYKHIINSSPFTLYQDDIFNLNKNLSEFNYKKSLLLKGQNDILKILGLENNNLLETSIYEMNNNAIEIELSIKGVFKDTLSYNFSVDSLDSIRVKFDFFDYGFGYTQYSDNIKKFGLWKEIIWNKTKFNLNYLFEEYDKNSIHNSSIVYKHKNNFLVGSSIQIDQESKVKYSLGCDIKENYLFDNLQVNYVYNKTDEKIDKFESSLELKLMDLTLSHYFNFFNDKLNSIHQITRKLIKN